MGDSETCKTKPSRGDSRGFVFCVKIRLVGGIVVTLVRGLLIYPSKLRILLRRVPKFLSTIRIFGGGVGVIVVTLVRGLLIYPSKLRILLRRVPKFLSAIRIFGAWSWAILGRFILVGWGGGGLGFEALGGWSARRGEWRVRQGGDKKIAQPIEFLHEKFAKLLQK